MLDGPAFVPASPMPDGKYDWRVAVLGWQPSGMVVRGGGEQPRRCPVPRRRKHGPESPVSAGGASHTIDCEAARGSSGNFSGKTLRWYAGLSQRRPRDCRTWRMIGDTIASPNTLHGDDAASDETGARNVMARNYCERVLVSMLASYYGGKASQDRIAYRGLQGTYR